jgi:iron complex outermembrane receptor protein
LDELITRLPEVSYKRTHIAECGPGREITLRGISEQKRTLVLLDGVPINDGINGAVNWSMVTTDTVERVEVVPGPMSALYGSGAMGGVINIITRTAEASSETKLKGGYGSLNTYEASAVQAGKADGLNYLLNARAYGTDGYVTQKAPEAFHSENEREEQNFFGKLVFSRNSLSDLTAGMHYVFEEYNRGVRTDNQENRRFGMHLTYNRQSTAGAQLTATLYGHLMNRDLDLGARPDYTTLDHTEKEDSFRIGELFSYSMSPGKRHLLTVGLDSYMVGMDKENQYAASDRTGRAEGKQALAALFAQDEMTFDIGGNRLIVTLGLRGDYCNSFDGASSDTAPGAFDPVDETYEDQSWTSFNPKLGLVYLYGDRTTFRLSGGRSYAAPTLFEMYTVFTRGPMLLYGNPDLDPESALSGEFGVEHRFLDNLEGSLSAYYTRGYDFIGSREIAFFQYQYDNINEMSAAGVSLDLNWALHEEWTLYGGYKYDRSRIEKDENDFSVEGNQLPFEPEHRGNLGLIYTNPKWVTMNLNVRFEDVRYTDFENTEETRLDDYVTVDLTLTGRFNTQIGWKLTGENLLDEPYDVYSIPLYQSESPGLLVSGSVTLEF